MDRDTVGTFWPYARLLAGLSPDASPSFRDACYRALVRHGLRRDLAYAIAYENVPML